LTGVDSASFAQAMISRPIVAAPLAGLLLGDPISGMWAGAVLEILSLRQLPIGANRGWDTGPAAVAAAAAAVAWTEGPAALLVAVAFGVVVGWLGSWSVHGLRHLNARLVAGEAAAMGSPMRLTARHLSALALDLLRAAGLTGAAVLCFILLAGVLADVPPGWADTVAALVVLVVASLGIGVDVRMMARGRSVWTAAGVGAALGVVIGLWLR
jgi:mannose/fructose/N-acetylgalactosamine-specific phosphotransferase system component IIC